MADSGNHVEVGGIGLVTVILALVFLFYWPGPFRYQYLLRSAGVVKIDRLGTGVWVYDEGVYKKVTKIDESGWEIGTDRSEKQ